MMKKNFILLSLVLLLTACAHGKTENFPAAVDAADAAELFIIRNNNLFGWGFSMDIILDEAVIAHLRSGENISFLVEPGFHAVGISNKHVTVPCASGQKYYFLISVNYTDFGFEIERISNPKGEQWISKTKSVE
jgi:hypothetical protein